MMTFRKIAIAGWLILMVTAIVAGCGTKISIPEPEGLYSVSQYYLRLEEDAVNAVQMAAFGQLLAVITEDGTLKKCDLNYEIDESISGLENPTAICIDAGDEYIFVWEQDAGRISVFSVEDLHTIWTQELTAVQGVTSMAANSAHIDDLVPGATTFVYMSDPDSNVVHRYAFEPYSGFFDYGILTHNGGSSARDVHIPAGLARDYEDSLLVCDADTLRNWVIRFGTAPDFGDTLTTPDMLRGFAALYSPALCDPAPAAAFVLGSARGCNDDTWTGGTSSEVGEFNRPLAVDVDGSGRIFVADSGNSRVQIFLPTGEHDMDFGNSTLSPGLQSIAVMDNRVASGEEGIYYGAYVFILSHDTGRIYRFNSAEQVAYDNAHHIQD